MTNPVNDNPPFPGTVVPFPREIVRPPKPARPEISDDFSEERLRFVADFMVASATSRLGITQLAARYDTAWGFAFGLWPPATSE